MPVGQFKDCILRQKSWQKRMMKLNEIDEFRMEAYANAKF